MVVVGVAVVAVLAMTHVQGEQYDCTWGCRPWSDCVGTNVVCEDYGCVNGPSMNCSGLWRRNFPENPPQEHYSGGSQRVSSVQYGIYCREAQWCTTIWHGTYFHCEYSPQYNGMRCVKHDNQPLYECAYCNRAGNPTYWEASHATCTFDGCGG